MERYPWPNALAICMGDDDKDEEAFAEIKSREGISILVSARARRTASDFRLASPEAARKWFGALLPLVN